MRPGKKAILIFLSVPLLLVIASCASNTKHELIGQGMSTEERVKQMESRLERRGFILHNQIQDAYEIEAYHNSSMRHMSSSNWTLAEDYSEFTKVAIDSKDWPLWEQQLVPMKNPGYFIPAPKEAKPWWIGEKESQGYSYYQPWITYPGTNGDLWKSTFIASDEPIDRGFIAVSPDHRNIYSYVCRKKTACKDIVCPGVRWEKPTTEKIKHYCTDTICPKKEWEETVTLQALPDEVVKTLDLPSGDLVNVLGNGKVEKTRPELGECSFF